MNEVPVPKGTFVVVDIQSSNVNKELWGEDALEWRLERWLEGLPSRVLEDARMSRIYSDLSVLSFLPCSTIFSGKASA